MSEKRIVRFEIYRYDPDTGEAPKMQKLEVELEPTDKMLLDALMRIKADNLTAIPLAQDANLQVGDFVVSYNSYESVVRRRGRQITRYGERQFDGFMQDAVVKAVVVLVVMERVDGRHDLAR